MQRQLPDNSQHSKEKIIHNTGGIRTPVTINKWPHTHALDRGATGIGNGVS